MTGLRSRPEAAVWITEKLEAAGFETWAVGGAVRDACLGRPSKDWDFATRATPAEVRRTFRRTVPIGIDHGTVGVIAPDRVLYEVTTFRLDVETDGRHAVVAFADTLEEDLARRDFTINAIAWHALRDEMRDPFGGRDDLERGVVRTVGNARERFAEDWLRILRALRFAGRFGFEIAAETWAAIEGGIEHLPSLSAERIRDELMRVLAEDPAPERALELYATSGALRVLYPELEEVRSERGPEWHAAVVAVSKLPVGRALQRLAALLRPLEPAAAAALLVRLKLSNAETDEAARRAGAPPLPALDATGETFRRWLADVGGERLSAVARIQLAYAEGEGTAQAAAVVASWRVAREVRASRPPLSVSELELDGRGLIALGLQPGPHFGRILDHLLDWVLEDPARNRRALLEERASELAAELSDD